MKLIRYFILSNILILSISVMSQESDPSIKLPTIIPPSPEVAQLGNVGSLSVGMHTGSANVSIPLYSFSVNSAKVNIALSYNSNGIKVDEIPGRAGLGWNLIAGGVVSRVIHDDPDGDVPYVTPPTNLYAKNQALLDYVKGVTGDLTSGDYDTEWDEYSYSFNGMSGKFFLDSNGNGHCIPHNNLKIKVLGYNTDEKSVEIITPDGVKYIFGLTTVEKTRNISIGGGETGYVNKAKYYETAWFLDKIITPEGRGIDFNYSPVTLYARTGLFQTMIKPLIGDYFCETGDCTFTSQSGINAIDYDTHYLTSIVSDGINVAFTYENRPDFGGDKRITNLNVAAIGTGTVKSYRFEYTDPTQSVTNKRFFLSKLKEFEIGSYPAEGEPDPNSGNWLTHEFQYDDITGMPERLTKGQDWFGYYNGVNNNVDFAPYIASIAASVSGGGSAGGNRNPGTLADMQKGILKKVLFPTGGYQEFAYEPHSILQYTSSPVVSNASTSGGGLNVHDPWVHTSSNFTANADQQVSISLSSFKSPALPNDPSGEGDKIFEFRLKKVLTGETVIYRKYYYYTNENVNVGLLNGVAYYLEMTIYGERNAGSVNVNYNPTTVYSYDNKRVGGIRVSLITSYDSVTKKSTNKFYTYASSADLTKSSGVGPLFTINHDLYQQGRLCDPGTLMAAYKPCDTYMVSANSISPYYTFGGSNVGYPNVIESDDPSLANGFIEHFFYTYYPGTATFNIILGSSFLGSPSNITTDINGIEYATKYFNRKPNGTFVLQKKVENNYETTDTISHTKRSLIVRKRYETLHHYTPPIEDEFDGFDIVQYNYSSLWLRQLSTVVTDYDADGLNPLVTSTVNRYDNKTHLQPDKVEITTSDNSVYVTENKFPEDLAVASPINVYQKMVNQNRIQEVVEKKTLKGATEISSQKTEYKDWNSDSMIIYPELIKTKVAPASTWDTRMRFHSYDSKGNVLQVSKENDASQTYIWDYYQLQPIAQVINAGQSQVAYTSFESNGKGNWTYSGTPSTPTLPAVAITGTKVYNPSSGSLTKSIATAGNYIVSYWSTSGARTVSGGTTLSTTTGRTANGWTLYEHKLTMAASSTVTVSGSGVIDELRLFPEKALMSTMTYYPLIGVSSQCDALNNIIYYTYDGHNRLLRIRDIDKNILKQYTYSYKQNVGYSLSTTAAWTATGLIKCNQTGANNNYDGTKVKEEMDMNSSSATYLQTRYVYHSTPAAPACAAIAGCTDVDRRVVNGGAFCEQATKVIVYSYQTGGNWTCMYYYQWSDGFKSQNYMGYSSESCIGLD